MWKQIRKPRLGTTDRVGYCLRYARKFFGIGVTIPTAWLAWKANRTKHKNRKFPKGVAVPLWWKYYIKGVNFGHVAIRVPGKGIYSSPYKSGQSRFVASSISQLERIYGLGSYVGWTETINGRRVIKREDMYKVKFRGKVRKKSAKGWFLTAKHWWKVVVDLRKRLKKTNKKLDKALKTIDKIKADDVQDELEKDNLRSELTEVRKDLDIAERKALEDDDTNEKVNALYNYFYERWQTFKNFITRSKE